MMLLLLPLLLVFMHVPKMVRRSICPLMPVDEGDRQASPLVRAIRPPPSSFATEFVEFGCGSAASKLFFFRRVFFFLCRTICFFLVFFPGGKSEASPRRSNIGGQQTGS